MQINNYFAVFYYSLRLRHTDAFNKNSKVGRPLLYCFLMEGIKNHQPVPEAFGQVLESSIAVLCFATETFVALAVHAALDYCLPSPIPGLSFIVLWGYYEAIIHVYPYKPSNIASREFLYYRLRGWLLVCWIYFTSTFARMQLLQHCLKGALKTNSPKTTCQWTTSILSLPNEKLRRCYNAWDFLT